jgi:hypothetical protein
MAAAAMPYVATIRALVMGIPRMLKSPYCPAGISNPLTQMTG